MVSRSYEEACAAAHALDLVGERWALLIVRELIFGPKRFTDLRASLPLISPNVLTQRLAELEEVGVLQRKKLPPPAAVWVYELTPWGMELEEVIKALGRWGVLSPLHRPDAYIGPDALMLSFRTMFDGEAAQGVRATVGLRLGEDVYRATIMNGELELVRGDTTGADVVMTGSAVTIGSVVYGGRKISDAVKDGDLTVDGSRSVANQFAKLFPLPIS